ERYELHHHVQ
nr:alpha protein, ClpB=peptide 16 [Escherichia coli, Peptide Partial, 10 aa] [Escherichia coli]AAB20277.1 beta 3 protein, ClpB=peptide 28 [Escherichia coli, Peptide Partial, 10 aa] [Escherichia coli]